MRKIQLLIPIAAYSIILCISTLSTNAAPFLVHTLMTSLQLDERQAGFLCSLEALFVAVGATIATPLIPKLRRWQLVFTGLMLFTLGNILSTFTTDIITLSVGRAIANIGAGFLVALTAACISVSANPDRLYAIVTTIIVLLSGFALYGVHLASEVYGYRGVYGSIGLLVVLMLPAVTQLKPSHTTTYATPSTNATPGRATTLTIVASLLLAIAYGAFWAFSERLGLTKGVTSTQELAGILSMSFTVGLLGSLMAIGLGARRGRTFPLIGGFSLMMSAITLAIFTSGLSGFILAQVLFNIAYLFSVPYLMGTASRLDDSGQCGAMVSGMTFAGQAIGPWLAGEILARANFAVLGIVLTGVTIVGLVCVLSPAQQVDRQAKQHPEKRLAETLRV